MFYIAQIIAIIICIIACISYLVKKKITYLILQIIINILYGIQYTILGAYSAAISNWVSILKYIVFGINAKNEKKNPKWQLLFFCILSVLLSIPALDNWYTLIPIITAVIFTYAVWQDSPIVLRIIVILCNILWIVFNIVVKAYVSAVYSGAECIFAIVTLIKIIKDNKIDSKE